ncbi:MAG TPA: adenosylcobinamide-GDP ribazoletransferase [Candidatus Binataceae bacterium]|nr:adenosylcobinamide-GDP ribazoletransferase [Candidatus Binataceae bacterium]
MSDDPKPSLEAGIGAPAGANDAPAAMASGILTELRLAFSFLTILPVIDQRRAYGDTVAASFAWFPIVGFVLGAALTAEDWLLAHVFGQVIRSVLIIVSLTIVTGAVHLDGLADTADALGAGRERERALGILRDSRVGTFGASAIFFDLTLKILALSTLAGRRRYAALLLAPMLARWAMLLVASGLVYLRSSGSGSTLLGNESKSLGSRAVFVAIFTLVAMLMLGPLRTIALASAVAIAIVLVVRWFYRRWLGGVTGDLIGACGELVEIAVLVTMAS